MGKNLTENTKFRLNEDSQLANDGKIYIFVKLTDSCMKAIENSIKFNKKCSIHQRSSIKFVQDGGGELLIPINQEEKKIYSFQISPENKTPEVFECIRQVNRNQLESCSSIEQRMNIKAQDDVYDMTKSKVTELQKNDESSKKQTKGIGESMKSILAKKSNNQQRTSLNMSTVRHQQRTTCKTNESNNTNSISNATNNNQLSILERPLREVLIHFLAVRKYSRPDLLLQLKYGSRKEEERDQLDSLLASLTNTTRTGEFFLQDEVYLSGEINPDWIFYSKEDSFRVKDKIHRSQTHLNNRTTNNNNNNNNLKSTESNKIQSNLRSTTNPLKLTTNNSRSSTTNSSSLETRTKTNLDSTTTTTTTTTSTNLLDSTLNENKIQSLTEMVEKLSNALEENQFQSKEFEDQTIDETDRQLIEREYHRLLPEYNNLYQYIQSISDKFAEYQSEFQREPNNEKASRIVKEFFKHEENEQFIEKRKRLFYLHSKLKHYQDLIENDLEQIDDDQQSDEHD